MSHEARKRLCDKLIFQKDSQRADLLDTTRTNSGLIALMLDVDTFHFEVTSVRSDHHDDGPRGHAGGRALDGWPLNTALLNVKVVALVGSGRSFPPLLRITRPVPLRPVIVPPTVNERVVQVTTTLVTFAAETVPLPEVTTHV